MSTEKGTENGRKGEKSTYRRNQQTDGAGQPGKIDLHLHHDAEAKNLIGSVYTLPILFCCGL